METSQWRIVHRLPEWRSRIIDRLAADTEFRSLCQDYDDCAAALDRFRQLAETSPGRVKEYEQILAELEADIRRALDTD